MIIEKVTNNGYFVIEKIEELSISESRSLVREILEGKLSGLAGTPGLYPQLILYDLYKELKLGSRKIVEESLLYNIKNLMHADSVYTKELVVYLLLSVGKIFEGSDKNIEVSLVLKNLLKQPKIVADADLVWRIGQALIAVGDMDQNIWDFFDRFGVSFGGIVFMGKEILGLEEAFGWLTRNSSNTFAIEAMASSLPFLIRKHTPRSVSKQLVNLFPLLENEELENFISHKAQLLNLRFPYGVLFALTQDEISLLLRNLRITQGRNWTLERSRRAAEEKLVSLYDQGRYQNPTRDMKIIRGAEKFVLASNSIDLRIVKRLEDFGDVIVETLDLGDDDEPFNEDLKLFTTDVSDEDWETLKKTSYNDFDDLPTNPLAKSI